LRLSLFVFSSFLFLISLSFFPFCNDEDPDKQGKQTIQPGENLEIESKF
jgi:hypothetical protein